MKSVFLLVIVLVAPSFGFEMSDMRARIRNFGDAIQGAGEFVVEASQGAGDMWRAYSDMRDANWKNSDKYFHARGNYEAANRGPGGRWASEFISDTRENAQELLSTSSDSRKFDKLDSIADQRANDWGRNGGDPNKYRPEGLPDKY